MLAVPTVGTFCTRLGVSSALTGVIVGASDFASMFATPGARPRGRPLFPAVRALAGARCSRRCAPSRAPAVPVGAAGRLAAACRRRQCCMPAGRAAALSPVTGVRGAQATRCGPTAASRRRWWPARSPACSATSCTASATTRARSGCWCCRALSWLRCGPPLGPAGGAPSDAAPAPRSRRLPHKRRRHSVMKGAWPMCHAPCSCALTAPQRGLQRLQGR